jgi:hypothetical protein
LLDAVEVVEFVVGTGDVGADHLVEVVEVFVDYEMEVAKLGSNVLELTPLLLQVLLSRYHPVQHVFTHIISLVNATLQLTLLEQ